MIPNVWMTSFCHLSSFEKRPVTLGPCPEIPRSVPNQNSRLVVVAVSWPASCVCKFLPCLWVKVVSMFRLGGAPEPNADCSSIKAGLAITVGTAVHPLLWFTIQIATEYMRPDVQEHRVEFCAFRSHNWSSLGQRHVWRPG